MNFDLMYLELERDEGRRNQMYFDSEGIATIGIGHNLRDNPLSARAIRIIFDDDLNAVVAELDVRLPWWRTLSEKRQRVFVNMAFNLGMSRFMGFAHMLEACQQGAWDKAAEEMLDSKWATQVGDRAKRLADMMREG